MHRTVLAMMVMGALVLAQACGIEDRDCCPTLTCQTTSSARVCL